MPDHTNGPGPDLSDRLCPVCGGRNAFFGFGPAGAGYRRALVLRQASPEWAAMVGQHARRKSDGTDGVLTAAGSGSDRPAAPIPSYQRGLAGSFASEAAAPSTASPMPIHP